MTEGFDRAQKEYEWKLNHPDDYYKEDEEPFFDYDAEAEARRTEDWLWG